MLFCRFGSMFLLALPASKITFEDWISFSCCAIWIMDDVKCAIFGILIMAVSAEIVIEKSGICVW